MALQLSGKLTLGPAEVVGLPVVCMLLRELILALQWGLELVVVLEGERKGGQNQ